MVSTSQSSTLVRHACRGYAEGGQSPDRAVHTSSAQQQARRLACPLPVRPPGPCPPADGRAFPCHLPSPHPNSGLASGCDAEGAGGDVSRAQWQPRGMKPPNPSDASHAGARGRPILNQDADQEEPGRDPPNRHAPSPPASCKRAGSGLTRHLPPCAKLCESRFQNLRTPGREHVSGPSPLNSSCASGF